MVKLPFPLILDLRVGAGAIVVLWWMALKQLIRYDPTSKRRKRQQNRKASKKS